MKYKPCSSCGGEVVDGKPHAIPLGTDSVMIIIDQECTKCGAAIIGENQKTKIIKDRKKHDKLTELFQTRFRTQEAAGHE